VLHSHNQHEGWFWWIFTATCKMALHHTSTSVAVSIVCLAVVGALSTSALRQFWARVRATKKQDTELPQRYEDKDGAATAESEEAYSDVLPRLIVVLISLVACGIALTAAIVTTTHSHLPLSLEQWLQFATWVSPASLLPYQPPCLTFASCYSCSKPPPYT
jgi:hypothetical protein